MRHACTPAARLRKISCSQTTNVLGTSLQIYTGVLEEYGLEIVAERVAGLAAGRREYLFAVEGCWVQIVV